jgi:hypothetical protein
MGGGCGAPAADADAGDDAEARRRRRRRSADSAGAAACAVFAAPAVLGIISVVLRESCRSKEAVSGGWFRNRKSGRKSDVKAEPVYGCVCLIGGAASVCCV